MSPREPLSLSNCLNRLSTKNLEGGENIYTRTIFPVTINNEIVIPVGTSIQGKIQAVERPGRVKGKASLTLSFQTMILRTGVTLSHLTVVWAVPTKVIVKVKTPSRASPQR